MKIKKGDRFYCFKDVVMCGGENNGKLCYAKGNTYISECDEAITDEFGDKFHTWPNDGKTLDHFSKIGQYKGDLEGFPELIVEWMLTEQELQGNKSDVDLFEDCKHSGKSRKGFSWEDAKYFDRRGCIEIIENKNFQIFFDRYPKGIEKIHSKTLPPIEDPECVEPELKETEWISIPSEHYNEWLRLNCKIYTHKQKIKKFKKKLKALT